MITELPKISRRSAFQIGGAGVVAVLAAPTLSSCAALPAVASFTGSWLADMSASLAATVLADTLTGGLQGEWASWEAGAKAAREAEVARGYNFFSTASYGDGVPPAVMFASTKAETFDEQTDRLIVCVEEGAASVAFDPWAWKALSLFVTDMTKGKDGDTLAGFQALCRVSLVPNAVLATNTETESGRSQLVTYKTRVGEVEMNRRTNEDGTITVQVVATGIPTAKDVATTREFQVD
ncbi:hypothetical protein SAMN06295909_1850 [Plantibacter sp. VKM Ac-1784]|uniref:Uncharacterized protein n=1 Tax=Plantibacter elymi (nom. nud.) TaxID=199708 RepID=A0ABY1RF47_9MICO|nr:hypothetical protein [Plantibacter sp. VKM Ac-1784]SMQ67759.1 hypothetical protein SAMN06295909_1850 [Plantibacter sp. VKM Ac-1784]